MEDAHLEIPKHVLLDGCMYLSYQILGLGCLFSGKRIWHDLCSQSLIQTLKLKRSRHIFSQYTSLLAQLAFVPFPLAAS